MNSILITQSLFIYILMARDVIRRLCNKDRDQGQKEIGIDHVGTFST